MSTTTRDSDSDDDTLTSSDCSESSDNESSEHDRDDTSDTASYRSLAFSVRKNRSTAIVKSKKSKKRVRFKPGDSLVLIYVIPNREMLGLKSDSEDSDYGDSDDESDDEEDDDDDDDDDEDDDEDNDDDSENDDDSNNKMNKDKAVKPKPFAKLLAVKQVNRRKIPDLRSNIKRAQEKPKPISLDLNSNSAGSKIKQRLKPRKKEKKDVPKSPKKESTANTISKTKQSKNKKNKSNSIKVDVNKTTKTRKNRPRLLEIRATVEADSKNSETQATVQKVVYKNDIKPNVIDVNDSVCLNSSKHLTNRTRLQPTSFRITKPRPDSGETKGANSLSERSTKVAQVVSASYESLSSVLPSSYINLNSIQNHTVEETIRRLDPESMNTSGKRNYAWQVANGTISSQSLRTPSILPFWDSLQNSVAENNTIKLPT